MSTRTHRPISVGMFGAVIALVAMACTAGSPPPGPGDGSAPPPEATPSSTAAAPAVVAVAPVEELLFDGRLLICSDLPYPPQEFFDERGNPVGSDIEIGQEIGRRLGLEATIVNSLFDTIIDAAIGGKCDIVISAQSITADREAQVDMIPYFKAGQTFVVGAGNPNGLRNELDLCGARVATQRGTIQSELIEGIGEYAGAGLSDGCAAAGKSAIRLVELEKDDEAVDALIAGTVDAYFLDSPAAGYHVLQRPGQLELLGLTLDVAPQGISVPKDRPGVRDAVRLALGSMIEDGTYATILARYGVTEGSIVE